jgi:hypothetical protein
LLDASSRAEHGSRIVALLNPLLTEQLHYQLRRIVASPPQVSINHFLHAMVHGLSCCSAAVCESTMEINLEIL